MFKKNQNHNDNNSSNFSLAREDDIFEFNLFDFIHFAYSRRYFVGIFSAIFLIVMLIWGFVIQKPIYKAQTTLNVNLSSKSQTFTMARFTNWLEEQEMQNKVYLTEQFFNSTGFKNAVFDEVIGKTNRCSTDKCEEYKKIIKQYFIKDSPQNEANEAAELFSNLEIYSDSDKYILTIVGSSARAETSLALTYVTANMLLELNYEHLLNKNSRVKTFLTQQTENTRLELDALEQEFAKLQARNGFIANTDVETRLSGNYLEAQNRLVDFQREKLALDLLNKKIEDEISSFRNELAAENKPSHLYYTQAQRRFDLLKYQIEIDKLSRTPGSEDKVSPESSNDELNAYKKILLGNSSQLIATDPWEYIKKAEALLIETRQKSSALTSQISAAQSSLIKSELKYRDMPETFRILTSIKRNIQITTELYSQLKARLQETNIQEAERANDLAILSLPDKPGSPAGISTNRKLVISIATGPLLAILLLLINYVVVPIVKNERDLQRLGITVIGRYTQYRRKNHILNKRFYPIILKEAPESYEANAIRFTRLKLEQALGLSQSSTKTSQKIISMSSINSGEGKTFACVNLAYSFALSKYKVALLDLDIKGSDMVKYFDVGTIKKTRIPSNDGHVHVDISELSPNLSYLSMKFSGVDYRDYMESDEFKNYIKSLSKLYDLIFIDTPPLDGHVESFLISSFSDSTLFIVNQRIALKDDVVRGLDSLRESINSPILSILNFSNEGLSFLKRNKKNAA